MDENKDEQKSTIEIENLIKFSSQLTTAIRNRRQLERQLHQLSFFKNFIELIRKNETESLHSVFSLDSKLVPNSQGETCLLTIGNLCPKFSFDSEYWSFNVVYCGRLNSSVTTWKFSQNVFSPNTKETISIQLSPLLGQNSYEPVKLRVNLIFCISVDNRRFERLLNIGETYIDVLYLLSPNPIQTGPGELESAIDTYDFETEPDSSSNSTPTLPPIIQFQLKTNQFLRARFMRRVLLVDSFHRGFSSTRLDNTTEEFILFIRSQRVIININSTKNVIQVKCFNLKLLFAIKFSIFQRLLIKLHKTLRISCVSDKDCDKLACLKLHLEAQTMEDNPSTSSSSLATLYQNYVILRKLTENIQFCMDEDEPVINEPEDVMVIIPPAISTQQTHSEDRNTESTGTGPPKQPSEIITLDSENEDDVNPIEPNNEKIETNEIVRKERPEKLEESSAFMEDDSYSDDDI